MAATYVDLIQMADSAIAGRDGYVLQLDVHVVFGYGFADLVSRFKPNVKARTKAKRVGN